MSRDLGFDDLPESERSDLEPYTPGTPSGSSYLQLITEFIAEYTSEDAHDSAEGMPGGCMTEFMGYHMKEFLTRRIPNNFNPNDFLDDLITQAASTDLFQDEFFCYMLTPLTQALYYMGYNNFILDFSVAMPKDRYLCVGYYLEGEEDNFLKVTYSGASLCELATTAVWTNVTHEGGTASVGHDGYHSEFTVSGGVELQYLGYGASDCVFRLNPEKVHWEDEDLNLTSEVRERHIISHLKTYNRKGQGFWKRKEPGSRGIKNWIKKKTDNKLFFPDGEGGWREVKP